LRTRFPSPLNIQPKIPTPLHNPLVHTARVHATHHHIEHARRLRIHRQPALVKRIRQLLLRVRVEALGRAPQDLLLGHTVLGLQRVRQRRLIQRIPVTVGARQEPHREAAVGVGVAERVGPVRGAALERHRVAEDEDLLRLQGQAERVHGDGGEDDVLQVGLREVLVQAEEGAAFDDAVWAPLLDYVYS
jgi:hypothetical protein